MNGTRDARRRSELYALLSVGLGRPESWLHPPRKRRRYRRSLARALRRLPGALPLQNGAGPADIEVEYCRLFGGAGPHRVSPYESLHRDGKSLLGPSSIDAEDRYRETGFRWTPDPHRLSDHISVELEYMAHLCLREARTRDGVVARAARDMQREFLRRHLGVWGPEFSRRLQEEAALPFYRGLGQALEAHLDAEIERLRRAESREKFLLERRAFLTLGLGRAADMVIPTPVPAASPPLRPDTEESRRALEDSRHPDPGVKCEGCDSPFLPPGLHQTLTSKFPGLAPTIARYCPDCRTRGRGVLSSV